MDNFDLRRYLVENRITKNSTLNRMEETKIEGMKQTAVEFLIDNLNQYYSPKWEDIVIQAKEMEKEQIMDAYWDGGQDIPTSLKAVERYYNETFK
jgi:hypothetical protein